ncbi:hypothetical protein AC579_2336 [Pseudocercospora musae]|uniref:Uncharacterized protein n=1 Tax=Pseudocercospora musae TaxID=113226 RepID=A0A139IGF5_9PEZI|nr:hypothetical protein AC579_2336 [Pseudocercospora musae]
MPKQQNPIRCNSEEQMNPQLFSIIPIQTSHLKNIVARYKFNHKMLLNTAIILGLSGAVLARPVGHKGSNNIVEVRAPTAGAANTDYIYTQEEKREAEADAEAANTDYIYTQGQKKRDAEAGAANTDYIYTQ